MVTEVNGSWGHKHGQLETALTPEWQQKHNVAVKNGRFRTTVAQRKGRKEPQGPTLYMYGEAPKLVIGTKVAIERDGKQNRQNSPSSRKAAEPGSFYGIWTAQLKDNTRRSM